MFRDCLRYTIHVVSILLVHQRSRTLKLSTVLSIVLNGLVHSYWVACRVTQSEDGLFLKATVLYRTCEAFSVLVCHLPYSGPFNIQLHNLCKIDASKFDREDKACAFRSTSSLFCDVNR